MEYLGGGSALDLMKAGKFEESHIQIILREVLKGLDYLHSEMKLHRDIKGNNDNTLRTNTLRADKVKTPCTLQLVDFFLNYFMK